MTGLRALTLIRPMPAAIVHGTKRIENRPQDLPRAWRGRGAIVAVHAGKKWDEYYASAVNAIDGRGWHDGVYQPGPPYATRVSDEGIVGLMRLTGRVYRHDDVDARTGQPRDNDDTNLVRRYVLGTDVDFEHVPDPGPWYSGPFGYEIADAAAFPAPIPCRGMQGFWPVPADVITTMRAQATCYGADALLEELFYEGVSEVKPCAECRSREGCEPECRVAPWNQESP